MDDVLFSICEVSSLEGMPVRTIRDRCIKEKFKTETVIDNGGPQYRIYLSSLTTEAKAKYWVQRHGDTFPPGTEREPRFTWLMELKLDFEVFKLVYRQTGLHIDPMAWSPEESEKRHDELFLKPGFAKETARERAQLLRGFVAAKNRAPQKLTTQAGRDYAAMVGVSYATLAKWYNSVKRLEQKDWEAPRCAPRSRPNVWAGLKRPRLSRLKARLCWRVSCPAWPWCMARLVLAKRQPSSAIAIAIQNAGF